MGAGKDDGERRRRSRGQLWGRSQAGAAGTTGYEGHGAQRDPRVIALPACATSPLCTRAMPGRGHRGASSSEVTGRVGSAASLYTSGKHQDARKPHGVHMEPPLFGILAARALPSRIARSRPPAVGGPGHRRTPLWSGGLALSERPRRAALWIYPPSGAIPLSGAAPMCDVGTALGRRGYLATKLVPSREPAGYLLTMRPCRGGGGGRSPATSICE